MDIMARFETASKDAGTRLLTIPENGKTSVRRTLLDNDVYYDCRSGFEWKTYKE
jgi:hypothetical protein